jgi:hypothetical protein
MDVKTLAEIPSWEWPDGTKKLLLGVLRDSEADEDDRELAAHLAGDCVVMNDELASELLKVVGDDAAPDELRGTAAISFGAAFETAFIDEYDDSEAVPISEDMFHKLQKALRELYADAGVPKLVRRRILEASVRAPEDWHTDAVRAAYVRGDEDWKLTAVFCMRFIRGFEEQIEEALTSDHADTYYQAICAAGCWEVDAAWRHIETIITSKTVEKPLLLAAIEAAAAIRKEDAAELFVGLMNSSDEDIVDAVQEAIGLYMDPWEGEEEEEEFLT